MMCGICGCGEDAETKIVDIATGRESVMQRDPTDEAGEHTHADGTRHTHAPAFDRHAHDDGHAREHVQEHVHEHIHADGTRHTHSHAPFGDAHDHSHGHDDAHADGETASHPHSRSHAHVHVASAAPASAELVRLEARILAKNDGLAARNRAWFQGREILALNLVSSPGAGKTTLLERTIGDLKTETTFFVVEGDQATANDGERIRAAGARAVQVNTGTGCHLEADMVARGLEVLKPTVGSLVMIENVGNLVCPALFDLGERAKVVILSVTEGEDKPIKYPHMFRAAELMILNKTDLLPHLDFDVDKAEEHARAVNPDITIIRLSAKTGEGLGLWYRWLRDTAAASRAAAFG